MSAQNGFVLAFLVAVALNQATAFFLPASTPILTMRSRSEAPGQEQQGIQRTERTRGLASAQLQVRQDPHQTHALPSRTL